MAWSFICLIATLLACEGLAVLYLLRWACERDARREAEFRLRHGIPYRPHVAAKAKETR